MGRTPKAVVSVGEGTITLLVGALLFAGAGPRSARAVAAGTCDLKPRSGSTIYVRTGGNDANDGASATSALRTIGCAAAVANAGARIVVGPGTYREGNIAPAAFARLSFVADRRGVEVGEPAGDIVVDASQFASGFLLNHNLAIGIDGFVIYGAVNGIYVKSQSDQAVITNNRVSNNSNNGIYIQDSRGTLVFNNLVYNNGGSGILTGGNVTGSPAVRVINNTVYKNGNRGIYYAGTTLDSSGGLALNNITLDNTSAGIQVNAVARDHYVSAGNVFADRVASGAPLDVTDRKDDPQFVNPAGADGMLGGPGYADDDFHLSQQAAGQAVTSPAVDAGSDLARRLKLARGTTRTDGGPDVGWVDAGYHYDNFGALPTRPELSIRYAPLYVNAASGADSNDGRSPMRALQSLARAFQLARPGDRVWLAPGVFSEGNLTLTNSGTPGRVILIQGMPGARIDATGFTRAILLSGRSDVTLLSLDISGGSDGIEIRNNSTGIALQRCRLHDNSTRGLYVNGAGQVFVRSGMIDHNGARGVQVDGAVVNIDRSIVATNALQGLWAINNALVSVTGSSFTDNGESGVLTRQSEVSVANSTITGGSEGAARFTLGSTGVLTHVTVSGSPDAGIQGISSIVNVADSVVQNNTRVGVEGIVDTATLGSNAMALVGTLVCDNKGPGVHMQDTAATLTDVTLCENGAEGLRQERGMLQMLGGVATLNLSKGLSVTTADAVTVRDAQLTSNGDSGLQVLTSAGVSISGIVAEANVGEGIAVLDSSAPVSIDGARACDNHGQGVFIQDSDATLTDATLCQNDAEGLRQDGGSLQMLGGAATLNHSKGISVSSVDTAMVRDVQIISNDDNGLQVVTANGVDIRGTTSASNAGDGFTVMDSAATAIVNNLVYGNGSTGILISGDVTGSPNAQLLNNTVYGSGNRGVLIGGSNDKPPSAGALVMRNIFQGNATAGLQVNQLSLPGYSGDYNLSLDPYGGLTKAGTHDVFADAMFIAAAAAAGDFHLSQRAAGQSVTSPAVDAGGVDVNAAGLSGTSTRTDGVPDSGTVDLGFHYSP